MLATILDRHYKQLLFKVPLSELEDKEKFFRYLKSSLDNEYSFFQLYNMMDVKEKSFYNILKPNFPNWMIEEDKFYNFCRVYVQYLLKLRKKQNDVTSMSYVGSGLNNVTPSSSSFGGSGLGERIDLNVGITDKKDDKPVIQRKNKYTMGEDKEENEDESVMVLTKTEYMNSVKKHKINQSNMMNMDMNQFVNTDQSNMMNMDMNQFANTDQSNMMNMDMNQFANTDQSNMMNMDMNQFANTDSNLINMDMDLIPEGSDLLDLDMSQYQDNVSNMNLSQYNDTQIDDLGMDLSHGDLSSEEETSKKKGLFGGFKKNKTSKSQTTDKMMTPDVKMSKNLQQKMG